MIRGIMYDVPKVILFLLIIDSYPISSLIPFEFCILSTIGIINPILYFELAFRLSGWVSINLFNVQFEIVD